MKSISVISAAAIIFTSAAFGAVVQASQTREQPAIPAQHYMQPLHTLTVNDAVSDKDGIKRMVILRGLDKITARATNIYTPIGVPVKYATLTITARYCYSTPITETPETTAFLQ